MKRILDNGENPLLATKVFRQSVDNNGGIHLVSLYDTSTLNLASTELGGRLLSDNSDEVNISKELKNCIESASFVNISKEHFLDALLTFEKSYKECIQEFIENGINYNLAIKQADDFAALLSLCNENNFTVNSSFKKILTLLLKVGTVDIANENIKIATPWHPERLKSLAIRQQRIINYSINLLAKRYSFIEKKLFNQSCKNELTSSISPEILYSERDDANVLISTSQINGYSLYEEPIVGNSPNLFNTSSNVESDAIKITKIIVNHLALHPHLKNNLNVVIYENNFGDLPYHLVAHLAIEEQLTDVKMHLSVVNSKHQMLDMTYRDLLNRLGGSEYDLVSREINDVFLSNLRVSIRKFDSIVTAK